MNGIKFYPLIILALFIAGCSSFKISPDIDNSLKQQVAVKTYSYQIETFVKGGDFELKSLQITSNLLDNALQITEVPSTNNSTHLSINIKQRSHGGACGQDYITGLSLGLIPSWCTRSKMYTFNFQLHSKGKLCSSKEYVIDETGYGHIVLLPFGLFELATGVYSKVLSLYKESLSSFIQSGCE